MTLQLPTLRAAENFSRALDGTAEPAVTDRYADLMSTVAALESIPQPTPRPEFATTLRAQLMAAAATDLVPATTPAAQSPSTRRRERGLAAAAAAFVLVGTTAGVATAADHALPGSTLYPIKRGIESAQVTMTTNETAKGRELLDQAGTRLDEVSALLSAPDATTEQVASTLDSFAARAAEGSDLLFRSYRRDASSDDISAVRDFTASSMLTLDRVAELAPPTSTSDFSQAATVLAEIDRQARSLCDDCSTAAALTAPASLVSRGAGDALANLISGPAMVARSETPVTTTPEQIAAAAKAAETAAGKLAPGGSSPQPGSGSGTTPAGSPAPDPTAGPVTSPVARQQPIKSIVDSVTTGLLPMPTKSVTDQLTDPLKPVTNLLDDTLDKTVGGLTAP